MTSTSSGTAAGAGNQESVAAQNNTIFWQNMDEVQEMQSEETVQDNQEEAQIEGVQAQTLDNFETEMENLIDPNGGAEALSPIVVASNPNLATNTNNSASKMTNKINGV